MLRQKQIVPWKLYFVYIHNRIHFAVFNSFISNGIFYSARTILHSRKDLNEEYMLIDISISYLCMFLAWVDIIEMVYVSKRGSKESKKKNFRNTDDLEAQTKYLIQIETLKRLKSQSTPMGGMKFKKHNLINKESNSKTIKKSTRFSLFSHSPVKKGLQPSPTSNDERIKENKKKLKVKKDEEKEIKNEA